VALVVVPAREIEGVELQLDAEARGRRLEHPHALRHDFLADAVAGNHGDAMSRHTVLSLSICAFSGLSPRVESRGDGVRQRHTHAAGWRTTSATPSTVIAVPASMVGVSGSRNSSQAISAVHGGTR